MLYPRFALYPYRSPQSPAKAQASTWTIPVDIAEEEGHYRLDASVPGIPTQDISITVHDGTLTIQAESRSEEASEGTRYRLRERRHGTWRRRFTLPAEVDAEAIVAEHDQGVLSLTIPKIAKPQPREIAINPN